MLSPTGRVWGRGSQLCSHPFKGGIPGTEPACKAYALPLTYNLSCPMNCHPLLEGCHHPNPDHYIARYSACMMTFKNISQQINRHPSDSGRGNGDVAKARLDTSLHFFVDLRLQEKSRTTVCILTYPRKWYSTYYDRAWSCNPNLQLGRPKPRHKSGADQGVSQKCHKAFLPNSGGGGLGHCTGMCWHPHTNMGR